jgi:hypothetical protein
MAYNFIECNREQQYLMPPSVKEWLREGDLSWFVVDAVEQMELSVCAHTQTGRSFTASIVGMDVVERHLTRR